MNTIDPTKKYRTRDGRAVTGLRFATEDDDYPPEYDIAGFIEGERTVDAWTRHGRWSVDTPDLSKDLVLAEDQRAPGLITPDPLRTEYGIFVAAVKCNYIAGTFAKAPPEQFDAWLESLTPVLRS